MKHNIVICKDHAAASLYAADLVEKAFQNKPELTVTFAAGDTPFACYQELIRRQESGGVTLSKARYIGLDEWVGLGPETDGSCIACMGQGYYGPAGIPEERITAFRGKAADLDAEVARMRNALREQPLELAVLGIGVNGHVGFNEPDTATTGDFSLVPLSETTKTVGKKYFAGKDTPTQGATITLQALKKASQVVIIATGANKQEAVKAILDGRADLPVCAFLDHPQVVFVFDEAAAPKAAP